MDWFRVSGRTGRTEASRVIYDGYGRPDGAGGGIIKSIKEFFSNKENAEWASNNLKSGWGWVDRNASSVGQFIGRNAQSLWGNIFGGGNRNAPVTQVMSNVMQSFNNFAKQATVFGTNYAGTIATNNITFGIAQAPYAFTGTSSPKTSSSLFKVFLKRKTLLKVGCAVRVLCEVSRLRTHSNRQLTRATKTKN